MDAEIRATTIDSIARAAADVSPDKLGVVCGESALTNAEIWHEAESFAGWLGERGVGRGDSVALWLPNGTPWVIAEIAAAVAGAAVIPVSTRLTWREAEFILDHSGCQIVVTTDRFLDRSYAAEVRESRPALTIVSVDSSRATFPHGRGRGALPGARPDDPAVIIYTSGTTGQPKGCVLSHRGWTNNARLSAQVAAVKSDDVVFSPSPFFHLFGSLTGLMGAMSLGATFITAPTFRAEEAIRTIQTYSVTRLVAVPTMWLDIMALADARDLPTLRGGVWGGGPFPRTSLERLLDGNHYGWDAQAIYGMTEAPTLTQVRSDDPLDVKLETVGRATPGIELRIVDSTSGRVLPAGRNGEIEARGYNHMLRYVDNPSATAQRFDGEWIRTGDIGSLDATGALRVVGRITDVIISGGANIYAKEVEDVLLRLDGIALVAVVAAEDERLGEVPVAWIELSSNAKVDKESILRHCKQDLAGYKVPTAIFFVEKMPLTAGGKIHRAALRARTRRPLPIGEAV